MADIGKLVVSILADTKGLEAGLNKSAGLIKNASGSLGGLGAVAGTLATGGLNLAIGAVAGLGVAAVGVGGAALAMAQDFDNATDALIAKTGASGDELSAMEQIAKNLKGSTAGLGVGFGDLGDVIGQVHARTNLTDAALETFSGNILTMSRLTGDDAVTSIDSITRVIGDWGLEMSDSTGLMDKLVAASQATGVGIGDITSKVVQFGAPMRLMGFSIDDSIALFAKWEKEGVNSELVMGSLRIAAGHFAQEQVPLQQGLQDTMTAIKGAATDSDALAIAMDVFGARAGPDMVAAIREGRFSVEDLKTALDGSTGALGRAGDATVDWDQRIGLMKDKVMISLIPLGDKFIELADNIIPKLTPVLDAVVGVLTTSVIPAITGLIDSLVAGFEGGGFEGLVDAFWLWIAGPGGVLETASGMLTSVIETVSTLLTDNWPKISATLTKWAGKFWEWISGAGGVISTAGSTLTTVITTISTFLTANWPAISAALTKWAGLFWEWLTTDVIPYANEKLDVVLAAITNWSADPGTQAQLNALGQSIGGALIDGMKWLIENTDAITGVGWSIVGKMFEVNVSLQDAYRSVGTDIVWGMITGFIDAMGLPEMSDVMEGAIRGAIEGALRVLNPAQMVIDSITEGIGALGGLGAALGLTEETPPPANQRTRGYALGGVVPGPVGQAQLAIVHGGETITPAGRGSGITVIFNGISAPTTEREANDAAFLFVNALRARGVAA